MLTLDISVPFLSFSFLDTANFSSAVQRKPGEFCSEDKGHEFIKDTLSDGVYSRQILLAFRLYVENMNVRHISM